MRVDVGQAILVKPGDVVWIRGRLPKSMINAQHHARLTIWSATPGYDFSPHVQIAAMGFVKDGKPDMVPPMLLTLLPSLPKREITFVADDILNIRVRQEVDRADDTLAKVKVKRYSMRWYRFIKRIESFFSAFSSKGLVHQ